MCLEESQYGSTMSDLCFQGSVGSLTLRHSREMTRVCSRNLTQRPAFGGGDNAFPTCGLRIKVRRFWWVTLSEHKWVILGERRGRVMWHSIIDLDYLR